MPVHKDATEAHKQSLGATLRRLRADRQLSQAELSRATGILSSFLSLVERGRSDIAIGRLLHLASFCNVELRDLLGGGPDYEAVPVDLLRADPNHAIHSDVDGVDAFDLTAGIRWTLLPIVGVGGGIEVTEADGRERYCSCWTAPSRSSPPAASRCDCGAARA